MSKQWQLSHMFLLHAQFRLQFGNVHCLQHSKVRFVWPPNMLLAPLALFFKCYFCQCSDRQSAGYKDLLATLLITIVLDLKSNGTKGFFFFLNVYLNSDSSTVQKYNYKEYRIEGPENGKPKNQKKTKTKTATSSYWLCTLLESKSQQWLRVKLSFSQIANLTRKSAIVVQDFRSSGK